MTLRTLRMIGVAVLIAAPALAAPRAVVDMPTFDAKVVAKGEVVKHTFEIRNDGDETLEITEVQPACGCTVTRFDKTVAPGSAGKIWADLDTLSFNGPIAKSVYVYTNDPETTRITLVIKADVRPYVGVDPGYARFAYVQGEQTGTISQTIFAPEGTDLEILSLENPYEDIEVTYRPATEEELLGDNPGKQWRVDITIQETAEVGALRDYIVVTVDHPKQKKVQIPISGFVRPRQHATPTVVDFGDVKGADLPYERAMAFTSFITDAVEITSVETGFEGIEAEVTPISDDGHRYQVLLRMTPDMPKGSFEGTIKLHVTDAKSPVFEVPVKGRVL